jgi:phosphomannomutase
VLPLTKASRRFWLFIALIAGILFMSIQPRGCRCFHSCRCILSAMKSNPSLSKDSLCSRLKYEPKVLKFGTSGRRGEVVHLTQLEIYINALAELEYLQALPLRDGGIRRGDEFYFAYDLRPSSTRYVPEQRGRGEIAQAIVRSVCDAGMRPVNLGMIPTPALTCFARLHSRGGMMITGSHIPFERNGYKTNTAMGELLKKDEGPINARVKLVRERIYHQPFGESLFDEQGCFKCGHQDLPPDIADGREAYIRRYVDFFEGRSLKGKRLLVYQHSAVGRDLLVDILQLLGAEVIPAGRSESFVPIDTENIDEQLLGIIQHLAEEAWTKHGPIDAVVSTDGDSDRPLLLGVEPAAPCCVRFFGGDLVGMIVAEHLGADAVVVPISCNDAVDRGTLKDFVEPKTRIGSPFVIAGMEKARHKGRKIICGWEANGGFLIGSDIEWRGKMLAALPTRDALLPILGVLYQMCRKNESMAALFAQLPKRFSRAALLKHFPRPTGQRIIERFSPPDSTIKGLAFENNRVRLLDDGGAELLPEGLTSHAMFAIREALHHFFTPSLGFADIIHINYTDGIRIYFSNGDIAHIRPSGNADELRIYAVADSQARADAIAKAGITEPGGILRQMESSI